MILRNETVNLDTFKNFISMNEQETKSIGLMQIEMSASKKTVIRKGLR